MKRLRKRYGSGIRYFQCGEYGEKHNRPHYHACLFNFDPPDKKLLKSINGNNVYTSESINELWPYGFSLLGDVTFESAAYVARYITKKFTGIGAKEHYKKINKETGEIYELKPEYTTMSRRPGIGTEWFKKYKSDVYPDDFIVIREKLMKPPKFYDKIFEKVSEKDYAKLKSKRRIKNIDRKNDNTPDRLAVREQIKLYKAKQLKRSYENET